jgi:hypothetical protein
MPTAHHTNPALKAYMDTFLALDEAKLYRSHYYPRLFYLWGHSYEFDRNQNWDLLDTIGQTLGGHDEIWYATNIEIYEYVTAYRSLVRSVDGTRIYNPTLHTVFFAVGKTTYSIEPGQTITIA